jgi:glycolate oxidase subunit GlcD
MTRPLAPRVVDGLRDIVGADHVITDPDRLIVYESDGLTAYRVSPRAVVLPVSTEEVSSVVGLLHLEGIEIVPRGAGTGLSGGALPTIDGVVVGTARMSRILSIDPDDRLARVQPGVINARLTEATQVHGLYYAPDPSSQSTCTLGGNVAENSGGPHCLKYGVTARYVSGLTVVLAGGRVVEFGGAGRESVGGLDLVGLFTGSEGCFGIATEIEVRLLPLAQGVRTLLGIFDTMEAAGHAVTAIIGSGLMPAAVEIVDRATIEAVEASVFAAGYPTDAGAALVIEFDGTEAGLDEDADRAAVCCRNAGAREVRRAGSEEERTGLWKGRKKAFGAMGRIAPDLLVQDATVPRTRLPGVLVRIAEIAEEYDLRIANVFHAGDGNLHPNILFDRQNGDELERVEAASKAIMQLCVDAGGTITGEHGVGVDKRGYMGLVHNEVELSMLRSVRRVFDPDGLFNPGKVVPDLVTELSPFVPETPRSDTESSLGEGGA